MRRIISLIVTVAFLSVLGLAYYGCSVPGESETEDSFKPDLNDPRLKERLDQDDGYAFAVAYGADIHGSLETCG